jgi:hypothetical protein
MHRAEHGDTFWDEAGTKHMAKTTATNEHH